MQHEIYNIDKNHFKALRVKEVMLQILQIVIDFQTGNFQLVCIFLFFVVNRKRSHLAKLWGGGL